MALLCVSYALNAAIPAATGVARWNGVYLRPCFFTRTYREAKRLLSEMAKRSPEVYHKQQETKVHFQGRGRPFSTLIFIYSRIAAAPNVTRAATTRTHEEEILFIRSVHLLHS